jgi:hypothetical protein
MIRNRLAKEGQVAELNQAGYKTNRLRVLVVLLFTCCLVFSSVSPVLARWDMGSAGLPTITGSVGGSVTGSAGLLTNLVVTVNFGELSPVNSNAIVKVVIPIAMRSDQRYRMRVSRAGVVGADPNSIQFSDIGFGIQNLRPFGNTPTTCGGNSVIVALFNNDPATSFTINAGTGRVQYTSSLANLAGNTLVLNGPQLSTNFLGSGSDDGWAFDAILAVKPQYFTPGAFGIITLTFTIDQGTAFPCV